MYNLRVTRIKPEDFASPDEEQQFYMPPEAVKQPEIITPEQWLQRVHQTFYLNPESDKKEPQLSPKNVNRWLELTGPSGSGKHSIIRQLESILSLEFPDQQLITEKQIVAWEEFSQTVKDQHTGDKINTIAAISPDYGRITSLEYFNYLLKLTEASAQQETNVITSWGALSTWNLLANQYAGDQFEGFIRQHRLADPIWELDSITQLSEFLTEDQVVELKAVMTETSNKLKSRSLMHLCPLTDTPHGIIFVSGQSLENCERKRAAQLKEDRPDYPRRWEHIGKQLQMQFRLVDAVYLRLCPETAFAINTELDDDFAQKSATDIMTIASRLTTKA